MKSDDPLDASLSRLPVPPASPGARDRALHRATIALRQSGAMGGDFHSREIHRGIAGGWGLKWGLAGSFALLVALAAAAVFWKLERPREMQLQPQAANEPSGAIDRVLLGQVEALFGRQLNAVVEYAGKAPDIRLSETSSALPENQSQPVVIEFRREGDAVRVLGFSGRAVCVELAGRQTCIEPLATGDGGVILSGESFCWTPQDRATQLRGYQVSASLLKRS